MKKTIKLLIFIIFIACFIYFGTINKSDNTKNGNNNRRKNDPFFGSAYVFESINHSKLLSKLDSKNANMIIYACFEKNDLCDLYGELVNDVARNYEIETIYYYDFKTDKENKNATYQKIVSRLSDYLLTDDLGNQNLYAPSLIFIKDGLVYSIDDDLAFHHGNKKAKEILNDEKIEEKREELINIVEGYLSNE